jgi:hypothetical protein
MAHHRGPKTLTQDLVFHYDTGNVKSLVGEPTTNYIPSSFGYGLYAYVSGPVDTTVNNEYNRPITAKRYTISNTVNTARAAIFPTTTISTYYTFSFKWKYNGTTTTTPTMIVSAAKGYPETNNNSFNYQNQTNTQIGNGWYITTYTFNFSSNPNGACILTFGLSTGSNTSYLNETFDVYEGQFEIKDHKTPYVLGTRSVTQGLIDLSRNATINLTNVSFNSNAQMTFDGTDDYVNVPNITKMIPSSTTSWEFVVKPTGTSGYRAVFQKSNYGNSTGFISLFMNPGSLAFRLNASDVAEATRSLDHNFNGNITLNAYTHIILTYNGTVFTLYINGTPTNTGSWTYGLGTNQNDTLVGTFWAGSWNGEIPYFRQYNRVLSAIDVLNNYGAIKSRFGL